MQPNSPPPDGTTSYAQTMLVIVTDDRSELFLAGSAIVRVGRGTENDVVITDPSVSRAHVVLRFEPQPTVEDLGSANGTRLAGVPIPPHRPVPWPAGTWVELGGTTRVILVGAEGTVESAPPSSARREAIVPTPTEVLARDSAMLVTLELLDAAARSPLPVLILGEAGVGKEALAQRVHRRSTRASGPFVRIDCAALPESILESELLGVERDADSGALHARRGIFEAAEGGTVFLDEIGDATLAIQAKLLRVLDAREVVRLGSTRLRRVDVRIVAAMSRSPRALVANEALRSDLLRRLDGIRIDVPPLRARPADIVPLAECFAAHAAAREGAPRPLLGGHVKRALCAHDWPGNERELRNAVERAVYLSQGALLETRHFRLGDPTVECPTPLPPKPIE